MVFSRGFTPERTIPSGSDFEQWLVYKSRGGTLAYEAWIKAGKPMVTRAEMLAWLKTAQPVRGTTTAEVAPLPAKPVSQIIPNMVWLYDDGSYRDAFGIVIGKTAAEARAWYEAKAEAILTAPEPMSDYEKASIALRQQELGAVPQWRPGEQELMREQFEWQKQQAQQQIAQSYEDWRRRLLSELTGPEDWITRWMIEQTPEKYPWAPPVAGDNQVDVLENQLDEQTARVQFLLNRAAYSATAGQAMVDGQLMTSEEITALLPSAQTERDATYKLWQQLKTEGVNWSPQPSIEQIAAQSVEGRTPPSPSWLSEFAPGQVAGRPITKEQIATPSGQQLTRLPPSQAAGLGGFAEWAGGRPWKDILAHAEIMQPFTPSGAGNRQWRPVAQGMV